MDRVRQYDVSIIAGHIMLKSGDMARRFNDGLSGVRIPEDMITELRGADDRRRKSAEIASAVIREIRPMCHGVHMMAIGWESEIPAVLSAAGITESAPDGA